MLAIGIDLGTTNSCVSVVKNGTVRIVQNNLGKPTTPSVISFGDEILFGENAKNKMKKYPENVIYGLKYLIGRNINDPQVERFLKTSPFNIIQSEGSLKISVNVNSEMELYRPEEITALLLRELKEDAEKCMDQTVDTAVITVPTYFEDSSRQATIDAGKIAGFKTIHLLNEPTAAAIAYGLETGNENKTVLVFDFGGGTFDISILRIKDNKYYVLAIDGDLNLGGDDVDKNLSDYVMKCLGETGIDVENNNRKLLRLKQLCESAKIDLTSQKVTEIELFDFLRNGTDINIELSRDKFNEINEKVLSRMMNMMKSCLEQNDIKKEDIDVVLLVGGSTRIQKIQENIHSYIGKVKQDINPDQAVAMGAAIMASKLDGSDFGKFEVNQICAHSIGKRNYLDQYFVFIPKYSTIPFKASRKWRTTPKGSPNMNVDIYVGEASIASQNKLIGNFKVENIFLDSNGERFVTITFEIDNNGILQVTADDGHGKYGHLKINLDKGNLTTCEINELASKINKKYIASKKKLI